MQIYTVCSKGTKKRRKPPKETTFYHGVYSMKLYTFCDFCSINGQDGQCRNCPKAASLDHILQWASSKLVLGDFCKENQIADQNDTLQKMVAKSFEK